MNANDVNEIINNICTKLGTTVEKVVPEYAKYKVVSNLQCFLIGVVFAIITTFLTMTMLKMLKKRIAEYVDEYGNNDWYDEDFAMVYCIGGAFLFILMVIATAMIVNGLDFVPWLVSPQGAFVAEIAQFGR